MPKTKSSSESDQADSNLLNDLQMEHSFNLELFSLPESVKRRLKALKKLQFESLQVEKDFYIAVQKLELEFFKKYNQFYEKRGEIVKGNYEPNDEECDWKEDDILQGVKDITINEMENKKDENTKGIPDFWLTIFKNVTLLEQMVHECDEPVLKHLEDIKLVLKDDDPLYFKLEFCFTPNEYFTNTILTKEYFLKCELEADAPFSFEGPEIYKCQGCQIDWKPNKNLTVKTVTKKQKHKSSGSIRMVQKLVHNDSFFNFFSTAPIPDDPDAELDEETKELLTSDFEIGHYLRERIIPRAVLYYTREALTDEEEEEEEEEEEGEDEEEGDDDDMCGGGGDDDDDNENDDDDDDDDDDGEFHHRKNRRNPRGQKKDGGRKPQPTSDKNQPPECKQQ